MLTVPNDFTEPRCKKNQRNQVNQQTSVILTSQ